MPGCTATERHHLYEVTERSWWGPGLWRMARVTPWCSGWTMTSVWTTPASWCVLMWSPVLLPVLQFVGIRDNLSDIASMCWPAVQSVVPTFGSQRAKHVLQRQFQEKHTMLHRLDGCQVQTTVGTAPISCLLCPGMHITHRTKKPWLLQAATPALSSCLGILIMYEILMEECLAAGKHSARLPPGAAPLAPGRVPAGRAAACAIRSRRPYKRRVGRRVYDARGRRAGTGQ